MSEHLPDVQRFDCTTGGMEAAAGGDFVYFADYQALQDRVAELERHGKLKEATPSQPGPHVHSMLLDQLGWICSVCYGWNHPQYDRCTHTHAVTTGDGQQ